MMIDTKQLLEKSENYFSFTYFDKEIILVSRRHGSYFDLVCHGFIPSLVAYCTTIKRGSNFCVRCYDFDSALSAYRKNVAEVVGEL